MNVVGAIFYQLKIKYLLNDRVLYENVKKQIEDSNETFSLQLSLPCFLHIYILAVNKLCCEGFIISHQHAKNKDTKIYVISSLFAYNLIL